MDYVISVIIPTKNRFVYCVEAIKSCLSLNDNKIEIVIQDNSDYSNEDVVLKFNNKNIKYNYNPDELSFVDNFSEAISISTGKYIIMIGDDDAILPNIIDIVKKMEKQEIDAVIPGLNSVYIWPNDKSFVKNAENGYLCCSYIKNKERTANVMDGLDNLLKTGGQNYQYYDIPRIYHGIVKRSCVEAIKKKTGSYFGGLTPDIYNAVALCYTCKNVLKLSYPITISGICPTSGSANSATGKHTGKLADAPHFKGHVNYKWDSKIPAIYSVESIWAETVLHALLDFGDIDRYDNFNITYLDAICYKKYPQFKNEISEHMKKNNVSFFKIKTIIIFLKPKIFLRKIIRRIFRKKNDVLKYYNQKNINDVIPIVNKLIGKN